MGEYSRFVSRLASSPDVALRESALAVLGKRFHPDQPRLPAGAAGGHGGEWGSLGHTGGVPSVFDLADAIESRHPGVRMDLGGDTGAKRVKVDLIRVDESQRGKGLAEAAMRDLLAVADEHGFTVSLTPEPLLGDRKTSQARLRDWYRRLGFVDNKGRARDSEIFEAMYRLPGGR